MDLQLLERYCSGVASSAEAVQIDTWLQTHPEQRIWYEQFRAKIRQSDFAPMSAPEREAAWASIVCAATRQCPETVDALAWVAPHAAASVSMPRPTTAKGGGHILRAMPRALLVWRKATYTAAAMAFAVVLVVVGRRSASWRLEGGKTVASTTYATRRGERADITLPDGSAATLNVASRLQVPADFAAGNHTVILTGEAVFHVLHHSANPFTVITGQTPTKVLGTTFLVRRYPTDTATTVSVRDGKVAVRSVVVSARQQVMVSDHGRLQVRTADLAQFSFANGVLTLDGVAMPQAILELDRWYDADIRVGDPAVLRHVLDATFAAGSLSDLSDVLTLALNVRVVRNGRVLTLYTR